jgi:hypothetical protein
MVLMGPVGFKPTHSPLISHGNVCKVETVTRTVTRVLRPSSGAIFSRTACNHQLFTGCATIVGWRGRIAAGLDYWGLT